MSIVAAELIAYNAQNRPTDDTSTAGGDIADPTTGTGVSHGVRPVFTQLASNGTIEAASNGTSDGTKVLTITGRNAAGAVVSDTITLSGTANTFVAGTVTFERIQEVSLSADAAGTITVRKATGGATIGTIPATERGFCMLFKRAASAAGITTRYDLIYWKNTNSALTLQAVNLTLTADPSSKIFVGVHTAQGNAGTITNRVTAPAGVTFVDDNVSQTIPSTDLASGARIGQWIRLTLAANDTPYRSTFTSQISGTTV